MRRNWLYLPLLMSSQELLLRQLTEIFTFILQFREATVFGLLFSIIASRLNHGTGQLL